MTSAPRPVISVHDVSRVFAGPPEVVALRYAELVVSPGDYVSIMGPSGSGKSTLLNLLGLLDRPSTGTYELDGVDVETLAERDRAALRGNRLGFVFQSFNLIAHRTALENVMLAQVYNGTPRGDRQERAVAALVSVGLSDRIEALPSTMSGGECQRVAVARALVNSPTVLLCDEPTGNLDSRTADRLLDLLSGLNRAGLSIVMITHSAEVASRSDRVLSISDGILRDGRTPRQAEHGSCAAV
jgi:putative ABC transport system ATP-binding protein